MDIIVVPTTGAALVGQKATRTIPIVSTTRWRPDPLSAERAAFLDGLRGLGYITGQNIIIEYRSAAWNRELLSPLAAQLVELGVDLILAAGPQATRAAREATQKIPIVMIASGALETGLVPSLARHGGQRHRIQCEPARTEPAWSTRPRGRPPDRHSRGRTRSSASSLWRTAAAVVDVASRNISSRRIPEHPTAIVSHHSAMISGLFRSSALLATKEWP